MNIALTEQIQARGEEKKRLHDEMISNEKTYVDNLKKQSLDKEEREKQHESSQK